MLGYKAPPRLPPATTDMHTHTSTHRNEIKKKERENMFCAQNKRNHLDFRCASSRIAERLSLVRSLVVTTQYYSNLRLP